MSENKTTKQSIIEALQNHEGWLTKGELITQVKRIKNEPILAETIGRQARTMAELGLIEVDYYKGKKTKKLARYAYKGTEKKKEPQYKIVERADGSRVAMLVHA